MANKWAIQNGNWSDGSIWNDGVVPTAEDDVWLNGKTVALTSSTVYAKKISNFENGDLSVIAGGFLSSASSNDIIYGDLEASGLIINKTNQTDITIIGNIIAEITDINSNVIINLYGGVRTCHIVGNILIRQTNNDVNGRLVGPSGYISCAIIGNINIESHYAILSEYLSSHTTGYINGNIHSFKAPWNNGFGSGQKGDIVGDVDIYGTGVFIAGVVDGDITIDNDAVLSIPSYADYKGTVTVNSKPTSKNFLISIPSSGGFVNNLIIANEAISSGGIFEQKGNTLNISGDLSILGSSVRITNGSYLDTSLLTLHFLSDAGVFRTNIVDFYIHQVKFIIDNPSTFEYIYEGEGEPTFEIIPYKGNHRLNYPTEQQVAKGITYGMQNEYEGRLALPPESTVLKDVEYGDNQKGTLEVIALSGATATAENISVVNLTEQEVNRVKNCATVSTVQKCFEDFKEE